MKLHYYPETDSLYIDLAERPATDSREVTPDIVLDFDDVGRLVGIDIQHASVVANLERLETASLPLAGVVLGARRARAFHGAENRGARDGGDWLKGGGADAQWHQFKAFEAQNGRLGRPVVSAQGAPSEAGCRRF